MIGALLEKDLKLFFRNQFNLVITVLSLGMFIAAFVLLPDSVDESLDLAVYLGEGVPGQLTQVFGDGIEAQVFDTEDEMIVAVEAGEYPVGMVFDDAALARSMPRAA